MKNRRQKKKEKKITDPLSKRMWAPTLQHSEFMNGTLGTVPIYLYLLYSFFTFRWLQTYILSELDLPIRNAHAERHLTCSSKYMEY